MTFGWFGTSPLDPPPENDAPADGSSTLDPELAAQLAGSLSELFAMAARAHPRTPSATRLWLEEHLGVGLDDVTTVAATWPLWQHATIQRAVEAYLTEPTQWIGLAVPHAQHQELGDLLAQQAHAGSGRLARAQWLEVASGPDTMVEAVKLGLCRATAPDGTPIVLSVRVIETRGRPEVTVEVLLADPAAGSAVLQRIRALADQHDVLRGQLVSFGVNENYGNQLVSFLPRPQVDADQVILPDGLLEPIVRHVLGIGEQASRLTELGIHLKRGLLLFGPPGTGKTHTVRHLLGRAAHATVIVLTGSGLSLIEEAAALARRLTPSIVVVEDVDLIAQDRDYSPFGNPLLFSLLDAMDGAASDADVTFLLTTNRPADLEQALVQRPGRVDLAVEIPYPGPVERERLLRLYAGDAAVDADLSEAVARTDGFTASALKELMRRSVLAALEEGTTTVSDAILRSCLDEFIADEDRLRSALRGAGDEQAPSGHRVGLQPGTL